MPLNEFKIANFKAFGPKLQKLETKPITLVFGPNSAGKSSVIHSLLWLNHAFESGDLDVRYPLLGKRQIDLGGFGQIIHRRDIDGRILVGMSFPTCILPLEGRHWWNIDSSIEIEISFGRNPASHDFIGLLDFRLSIDGSEFLRSSRRPDGTLRIDLIDFAHSAMERMLEAIGAPALGKQVNRTDPDERIASKACANAYLDFLVKADCYSLKTVGLLPSRLDAGVRPDPEGFLDAHTMEWIARMTGVRQDPLEHFHNRTFPDAVNQILLSVRESIQSECSRLEYIPPLRELPPRAFDASMADSSWKRLVEEPVVLEKINRWLGSSILKTRYRLEVEEFVKREDIRKRLPQVIFDQILALISKPDFSDDLSIAMQEVRSEWEKTDHAAYLKRFPEHRENLIRDELDGLPEWAADYEEISEEERYRRAEATVEDIISNEPFGDWAEPLFFSFLSEHPDFESSFPDHGMLQKHPPLRLYPVAMLKCDVSFRSGT